MHYRTLLIGLALLAQTARAQEVLDKIATQACSCMKDVKDEGDADAYQTKMGLCVIQVAMPYSKELKKKYDLNLDHLDESTGQKLGMLVVTRMTAHCPDVIAKIAASAGSDDADDATTAANASSLDGEVTSVRSQGFTTITVRSGSGRPVELLWLEFFDGADQLTSGTLEGRKGTFSYVEREFLDPATKAYRKYNVITGFKPR